MGINQGQREVGDGLILSDLAQNVFKNNKNWAFGQTDSTTVIPHLGWQQGIKTNQKEPSFDSLTH